MASSIENFQYPGANLVHTSPLRRCIPHKPFLRVFQVLLMLVGVFGSANGRFRLYAAFTTPVREPGKVFVAAEV